jgi:hypothetical protein
MNGGEVVFNIKADSSDAKKEIQQTGEAVKDVGGGLEQAKTAAQEFSEAFKEAFKEAYDEAAAGAGEVQSATDAAGAGLDTYKKRLQERVTDTLYDYALQAIQKVLDATKQLVTETAAAGDAIDKNSQRLGMTNEAYQEWTYILSQNGADISTLTTGMRTLTNQIDALGSGSKTAAASFEKLGLSYEDLSKLTGEQQFSLVVERLQGISDQTERNAIANDVLGRSYMDLVPLLNQSADSVENLRQRAHETGQIMTDEGVTAAVNYTDAMDTLSRSFDGFKQRIGAQILPGITEVAEGLTDLLTGGEDASEKIQQGIDETLDAVEEILPEIGSIAGRLAGALTDNAGDIIDRFISSLADFLSEDYPQIIYAAIEQALKIVTSLSKGITDNADEVADAIPDIIGALLNALLDALPDVIASGEDVAQALSDAVIDYDWANFSRRLALALVDALERTAEYITSEGANNPLAQSIKSMIDPTGAVGAGMDVLGNVVGWDNIRDGINAAADAAEVAQENAQSAYNELTNRAERYNEAAKNTAEEVAGITASMGDAAAKTSEEAAKAHQAVVDGWGDQGSGQSDPVKTLDEQLTEIEHLYAIHQLSEEDYLQQRLELLEQYRNDESEEWWADYDKTVEQINKLSQAKIDAQEKTAKAEADAQKKRDQEAAKAASEQEKALKQSVTDKFRELETEQLENGYDDQWLIDQENAFIETLDHESDLYKEYHLKLLKEQESYNDKAEKAEKEAADERYKSISKLYEDVAKAQEQLSDSLDVGVSDIFRTETESDKRTGADRKKKSIAIDELEKQIEAKRQLPAKIADLLDSDVPDELIRELLKLDPSDALEYANKLLSSPETMSRITKAFDEDRSLSDQLAGMLTENTEDFDKLGYESGKIFGESFLDSLGEQWKERFGAIVTDEAVFNTLAAALPFMGTMNSVVTDSAQAAATGQRAQAITVEVTGKLTADGDNITAMVNSKNAKTQIIANR